MPALATLGAFVAAVVATAVLIVTDPLFIIVVGLAGIPVALATWIAVGDRM